MIYRADNFCFFHFRHLKIGKKAGQTSFSKWNGRTHASETVTPNATWNGIQLYCVVTDSAGKSLKSGTAKITIK